LKKDSTISTKMFKSIHKKRIPIHANLELTHKCNFKCIHCYQTPMKDSKQKELSLNEWKTIIDILKKKGTIFLTLIGGEVTLNENFIKIYEYAYKKNFKISIDTNGSFINNEIIESISLLKPLSVEITLYGISNDTYKKFTGVCNGWDIVKKNIVDIVNKGIKVKLKTVGNIINEKEIVQMKQFSDRLGVGFKFYSKINCYTDGNASPKRLQLSPCEILSIMNRLGITNEYINYIKNSDFYSDNDIKRCSAGLNKCYIDPYGCMFLCNGYQESKFSINKYGFDYCWEQMAVERQNNVEISTICGTCENRMICGMCAPKLKKEYGNDIGTFTECKYGDFIKRNLLNK